jgi:MFS family permease
VAFVTTNTLEIPRPTDLHTAPAAPPRPAPAASAPALSRTALATVLIGALLPITDFFIVNVALPTMSRTLHASDALLELVVAGYGTAYAVLLVLGGRLGDAHGRRRLFLAGMATFTLTSLLCGLAPTAGLLVAARILQGASAALMVPQTLSTIQATGDMNSRAKALGWYGATAGIAAVIGQVVGGLLVSADIAGSSWRPIFLVNVPIGLVGLVLAARLVPETKAGRAAHLDREGTVLLAAFLTSILIPLTEGQALGWPWWSWTLLGIAPVLGAAFVYVQRRHERNGRLPLLPPAVIRLTSMRRGLLMLAPFFVGISAFMFVYALVFQGTLGFSPIKAGLTLAPFAIAFLLVSLQMPRLVARYGHHIITAGAAIQFVGLLGLGATLFATWPHVHPLMIEPALLVLGAGQGLVAPALFRQVLSDVPVADAGAGSGVLGTTQQVSLALGVAALGTLFIDLAPAHRLGVMHSAILIIGIQALVAAGVALASTRFAKD